MIKFCPILFCGFCVRPPCAGSSAEKNRRKRCGACGGDCCVKRVRPDFKKAGESDISLAPACLNAAKSLFRPTKPGPPQSRPLALWGEAPQQNEPAVTLKKVAASDMALAAAWWRRVDSNHRSETQQIYSLPPLATRELPHMKLSSYPPQPAYKREVRQVRF